MIAPPKLVFAAYEVSWIARLPVLVVTIPCTHLSTIMPAMHVPLQATLTHAKHTHTHIQTHTHTHSYTHTHTHTHTQTRKQTHFTHAYSLQ